MGIALAGISALTTASAHATVKGGESKLAVRAWVSLIQCACCLPVALWLGLPSVKLLPWLAAAWVLHVIYQSLIISSYRLSDFSLAFPIARGTAPLVTVGFAALFLGEYLGALTVIGIAILSMGIFFLGWDKGLTGRGFVAATGAGLLTALYTVVDAQGVRLAETALRFIAWFFVLDVLGMPLALFALNGRKAMTMLRHDRRLGLPAAFLSLISFGAALFALDFAPAALVAAIRETSIVIGLLIGTRLFKERVDKTRYLGAIAIAFGAVFAVFTIDF
jgi:drug/metabolite transporter (DMT)-like permease